MRFHHFIFAALLMLAPAMLQAEEEEKRFYFGTDFGFSSSSDITSNDFDNDVRRTACDQFLRLPGDDAEVDNGKSTISLVYTTPNYNRNGNCAPGDTWVVEHGGGTGQFGSLYSGYKWPEYNVRAELEYRWLSTEYDDDLNITLTGDSDPKNSELETSRATFDSVQSVALFANGYVDYKHKDFERWTFFVGGGIGWAHVSVKKSLAFSRNTSNDCNGNCLEFPPEAAGTTTYGVASASDGIFRAQAIAGAAYEITPRADIRFKLRYDFGLEDFSSDGHAYDRLRGHEAYREPEGTTDAARIPVLFGFGVDDLDHLVFSIGLSFDI